MAVSGPGFMRQLAAATHNRRLGDGCHLESVHNGAFPRMHALSLFPNILLSCPQAGSVLLIKTKSLLQMTFSSFFSPQERMMRWYYMAGSQSEREDPINHSVICAPLFYYLRGGLLSPGVARACKWQLVCR